MAYDVMAYDIMAYGVMVSGVITYDIMMSNVKSQKSKIRLVNSSHIKMKKTSKIRQAQN